jgi:hypothetical protein
MEYKFKFIGTLVFNFLAGLLFGVPDSALEPSQYPLCPGGTPYKIKLYILTGIQAWFV